MSLPLRAQSTDMQRLADTPEARIEAVKFGVPPDIHADDFIFQYHLDMQAEPNRDKARAHVTEYYFFDGDRSAKRLDGIIREHHPHAASRRLSLFEFASGYGCVSRHLRKMSERYDLVACDIHEQAITFLQEQLGVKAVLSHSDPHAFDARAKFDVVFALSFFSHMPDRTFSAWIEALFSVLADDGLLVFTSHGRIAHEDMKHPELHPSGYWFTAASEQKDIPTDEYGAMIATPFYVTDYIARCPGAALVFFQEAYWWGKQDLFIVRKVPNDFRPQRTAAQASSQDAELEGLRATMARLQDQIAGDEANIQALHDAIATIHRSTSWRVTSPLRKLRGLFRGRPRPRRRLAPVRLEARPPHRTDGGG
jgi:Methyltransferase domain